MTSLATNDLSMGEAPETQPDDDRGLGRPGKAPTIYDVARAAGVSHQTVSRVLNDRPGVSLRTRSAVLEAITTTGFVANAAARGLRSSVAHDWGLLLIGTPDPSSWPLVVALTSGAASSGGAVTLEAVGADDRHATERAIRKFLSSRIRGFVVVRGFEVTRFLCGP